MLLSMRANLPVPLNGTIASATFDLMIMVVVVMMMMVVVVVASMIMVVVAVVIMVVVETDGKTFLIIFSISEHF